MTDAADPTIPRGNGPGGRGTRVPYAERAPDTAGLHDVVGFPGDDESRKTRPVNRSGEGGLSGAGHQTRQPAPADPLVTQ